MKLTKSAILGAATAALVAGASFIAAAPAQAYSGGGCSGWSSGFGPNPASVKSCVSENGSTIYGTVYWSNTPGGLQTCKTDLKIRDDTTNTYVEVWDYNCDSTVQKTWRPTAGHRYHVYGTVSYANPWQCGSGLGCDWGVNIPNSPELYA
jgi:hypothetical protein